MKVRIVCNNDGKYIIQRRYGGEFVIANPTLYTSLMGAMMGLQGYKDNTTLRVVYEEDIDDSDIEC